MHVLLCHADSWCRTLHKACANTWSTHICGWVHFILLLKLNEHFVYNNYASFFLQISCIVHLLNYENLLVVDKVVAVINEKPILLQAKPHSATITLNKQLLSSQSGRIDAFFKRAYRCGLAGELFTVDDLYSSGTGLFKKMRHSTHCLNHLLPPIKSMDYVLRNSGQSYILPHCNYQFHKNSFIN